MDATTMRLIFAVMAAVLLGVIVVRRRKQAE